MRSLFSRRTFTRGTGLAAAGFTLIGCAPSLRKTGKTESKATTATTGPLRVHSGNPRYFADATGRTVYLTGSHTWNTLADMVSGANTGVFDFTGYLDFLDRYHHNFIRLWRSEALHWDVGQYPQWAAKKTTFSIGPHPWLRSGPGTALDGLPRFDLDQFDPVYFQRLRDRVRAARERGIYVSVMLFEGFSPENDREGMKVHMFHPENNVNGINGDVDGDGRCHEAHTMQSPFREIQEKYVRKVVDTVNDLDNVLYEISNETGTYSLEWQNHMIRYVKEYERTKAQQHPVGITFLQAADKALRGTNQMLLESPADWISPNHESESGYDYKTNPPPADGRKVILSDTDHIFGIGGDADWVWKNFTRGHNPIFMDPYDNLVLGKDPPEHWDSARTSMGQTRRIAERMDLATLTPREDLASTKFCLADPGRNYVVYLPEGGQVELDLTDARGKLAIEWIDPITGASRSGGTVDGGARRQLVAPAKGPMAVLASLL